jgi:hypothetical protein
MKEAEYIKVKDLGTITGAKNVLRGLVPETSDIIKEEDYNKVMEILTKWEIKHYSSITTNQ